MITRRLYSDAKLIADLVKMLEEVEVLDEGWSTKYVDPGTGEYWLMYQMNAEYHGGGQSNLFRLPEPDSNELIQIIITTKFDDEAVAAAALLSHNEEVSSSEFRDRLIEALENVTAGNLTIEEKEKFKRVITSSTLDSSLNRRSTMNKTCQEVLLDAAFFQRIATKATKILKKLNSQ
jgi:hypothetical protein